MINKKTKKIFDIILENWAIKVVCLAFAFIVFLFYRRSNLGRRSFSTNLKIENSSQFVIASGFPHSVKITLWGDALTIASVKEEDIEVYLDLNPYTEEGEYKVPVRSRVGGTALGVEPLDLKVEPKSIELRLEQLATKKVPIYLVLKGNSAGGFEVSQITIKPETVEVHGPKSVISRIESIPTEPVIVKDRSNSFSGRASLLNENSLVSISGTGLVDYSITIAERLIVKDLKNIPVQIKNLDPNLKLDSKLNTVLITISGKQAILDAFEIPEDIASIDCSEITTPGEYSLPVAIREINGIEVKTLFPDRLAVNFVEAKDTDEKLN